MVGIRLRKSSCIVLAFAALVALSSLAAMAQNSPSTTAPTATAPGQLEPQPQSDPTAPLPTSRQAATVQPPGSANSAPQVPITVPEDTLVRVLTNESLNSKRVKDGTPVLFTVSDDVLVGDALAIPRGATCRGMVIESKKAGVLTGSPELTLRSEEH